MTKGNKRGEEKGMGTEHVEEVKGEVMRRGEERRTGRLKEREEVGVNKK